jgi:hypothetical protein
MAVATLVPLKDPWPSEAHTEQEIRDALAHCRELLMEHDSGLSNKILTRQDITRRIDKWLDELCQLKQLWWIEKEVPRGS